MTNLEFYKDELKEIIDDVARDAKLSYKWKVVGEAFEKFIKKKSVKQHIFDKDRFGEGAIDWLLEEHKELIKLTKFEYDLLKCYQEMKDGGEFVNHHTLKEMQYKGHFQDVDYNLTIDVILDNCEVVD